MLKIHGKCSTLIRLLLGCLWVAHSLHAQVPDPMQLGVPALQVFGEREGLPHPTLHTLALDGQGRIWVGTQDGAAFFNGRSWTGVAFPKVCKSRFIRALALTPDGSTWFGTQDDGLWQWAGARWIHHDASMGLPARRINHLQWAPEGPGYVLWAATADGGVARLSHGIWKTWGRAEGLRDPWVWRVRITREMTWVMGLGGLAAVRGDRIDTHPLGAAWWEPCSEILDLRGSDGQGDIFLSCWDKGLVRLEKAGWCALGREERFPSRYPTSMVSTVDPDGTRVLWVGTYDRGLTWKRGKGPWVTLDPSRGFPSTGVYDLLADPRRKPALWIAMRQGGLGALDPGGWIRMDTHPSGPLNHILCMARSSEQGMETAWFGTEEGVLHWDGTAWVREETSGGVPATLVNALLESRAFGAPRLVAGTINGLALKQTQGWVLSAGMGRLGHEQVMALLEREEAGAPALWVGTEGGLARLHRGTWTVFTKKDGLPGNLVYALASSLDKDGQLSLWAGTRGGGVARYKNGEWIPYGMERGLPNPSVYGLLVEPLPGGGQRIWAATYGGGLAWINPDDPNASWGLLSTTTRPALPSDATLRLERDRAGRIYVMTTRGVARLEGPPNTEPGPAWTIVTYTEGDGLPSRLCNQGASFLDAEGRLWVGTALGLAVLDPRVATTSAQPGPPNLDRVLVNGSVVSEESPLELQHNQGTLAFEYSLPVFNRNEDLRYQSQILGWEKAPSPWTADAKRELTGLGPGHYILRVRARDHLGRETQARDIPFRILPAIWRTPTAYALYILVGVVCVWGIHRLRVNFLEARNRELSGRIQAATSDLAHQKDAVEKANLELKTLDETKSRMLGIVAHDLRNPLSAILMSVEFLAEPDIQVIEANEIARKIQKSALFMHELLRRFLDLEAIERGKLEYNLGPMDPGPAIERVVETHVIKARGKGLELVKEIPSKLPALIADETYLQEVLENLISNAIKFTPKGPPAHPIILAAGPGWVEVRDQGPGFTAEDKARIFGQFVRLSARPTDGESSTGLGLAIVKALVEGMGGRITLESAPGQGSVFRVEFPLA